MDKTQHPVDTCLSQHERPKSISNIYEYQYRVLFTGVKNPNGSVVELQYERWFKYLFFVFQETEPNHAWWVVWFSGWPVVVVVTVQRRILTSLDFFLYKHYSVAPRVVLSLLAVGVLIPLEYLVQVLSPQVFFVYRTQVYLGSDLWVRVSVTEWGTFLKLNLCDFCWWRYQLNTNW